MAVLGILVGGGFSALIIWYTLSLPITLAVHPLHCIASVLSSVTRVGERRPRVITFVSLFGRASPQHRQRLAQHRVVVVGNG